MLVEHARNVLGIGDASHAESSSSSAGTPIVTPMSCSLDGETIEGSLAAGSVLSALHGGASTTTELTTCNYGLDPARQDLASAGGMTVCAVDDTTEVRAVERADHPFFVATLYQPQLRSTPSAPHPIWLGFVAAILGS